MSVFRTDSEDATVRVGAELASKLKPGDVVLLTGNLGAGKTTITKGIVQAIHPEAAGQVASPTFTLIHEYGERAPVIYHVDLYRLDTEEEVATLGLDEIFDRNGIVLLEWGERFPRLMPERHIEVTLMRLSDDERQITIRGLDA